LPEGVWSRSSIGEGVVKYTEVTLLELAENPDHFAVLGVPVTANDEQVKAAYFELVRQLHPDRCRGTDSDLYEATLAAFMRVGRAWEVLKDVRSRRAYKRSRAKLRPAPRQSVDVGAIIELAAKRLHGMSIGPQSGCSRTVSQVYLAKRRRGLACSLPSNTRRTAAGVIVRSRFWEDSSRQTHKTQ
jgi:curved DNA-binding protein CbpA